MDVFHGFLPLSQKSQFKLINDIKKDDIRYYLNFIYQLISKKNKSKNYSLSNADYRKSVSKTIIEEFINNEENLIDKIQKNIIQSLKIISIYYINDNIKDSNTKEHILYIIEILIYLIPDVWDLVTFIDFLIELVKILPIDSTSNIVNYIYSNLATLKKHYLDLELQDNKPRRVQTAGAKLIMLVKTIENRLTHTEFATYPLLSFQLRCLLVECLPMSHLGISNKQGLSQIQTSFPTTKPESLKFLENLVKRPSCETLNNLTDDINENYKYKICVFEPILKLPSYEVYNSYINALSFSHFAGDLSTKDEPYFTELLNSYQCLFNFYRSINPSSRVDGPLFAWYTDGIDRSNGVIFSMVCNDIKFWKQFMTESFMALMDLYRSRKPLEPNEEYLHLFNRSSLIIFQPDKDCVYSSKSLKARVVINEIQKAFVKFATKLPGFIKSLTSLLATESQWVYWKRKGCSDIHPEAPEIKKIEKEAEVKTDYEMPPWISWLKDCLEDEKPSATKKAAVSKGGKAQALKKNRTYENFLVVDPIDLNRQAEEWGLDIENGQKTLEEKLSAKLRQYREKMKIDLDPENQVETPSSGDCVFRFRLGRLFSLHYLDKSITSSYKMPLGNTCSNMEYLMSSLDMIDN